MLARYLQPRAAALLVLFFLSYHYAVHGQSGNSTSITGVVVDPSGAVIPNATVEVRNPVSGFSRSAVTDTAGKFTVPNVPFNPYHLTVTAQGFAPYAQDVEVRSSVPLEVKISLQLAGTTQTVTVSSQTEIRTVTPPAGAAGPIPLRGRRTQPSHSDAGRASLLPTGGSPATPCVRKRK